MSGCKKFRIKTGNLRGRIAPVRRFSRANRLAAVKFGIFMSALLVLLPGIALGKQGPRLSFLSKDAVVLAFGDSITYGIGAVRSESYPETLEKLIGRKIVSAGVPGELSSAALRRLPHMIDKFNPRLVIVCHGCNDLIHGVDERVIAGNIRAMVRLARERGTDVVLIGVPRIGVRGKIFPPPQFYRQIAAEFDVAYAGDALMRILEKPSFRADAVHLNGAGYRRLAEVISHLLRMNGAI